jgi:hypothetical protein
MLSVTIHNIFCLQVFISQFICLIEHSLRTSDPPNFGGDSITFLDNSSIFTAQLADNG